MMNICKSLILCKWEILEKFDFIWGSVYKKEKRKKRKEFKEASQRRISILLFVLNCTQGRMWIAGDSLSTLYFLNKSFEGQIDVLKVYKVKPLC